MGFNITTRGTLGVVVIFVEVITASSPLTLFHVGGFIIWATTVVVVAVVLWLPFPLSLALCPTLVLLLSPETSKIISSLSGSKVSAAIIVENLLFSIGSIS